MNYDDAIAAHVRACYWEQDDNCARTTLMTLSRLRGETLHQQVLDAALGMHGAGRFGAQCGLVEGTLMFIGVLCARRGLDADATADLCRDFAATFTARFGALECRRLRPGGFTDDDPPHLCEELTRKALACGMAFLEQRLPPA